MTTRAHEDSPAVGVSDETDRSRSRRSNRSALVAIALLLLLSLCSWCLFWPVPQQQTRVTRSGAGGARGAIRIEIDETVLAQGSVGSKGQPVVIRFTVTNRGAARSLTPSCFKLQIDRVSIPPLDGIPHEPGLPVVLRANSTVKASAVFAVPNGATEATLSVNPPDLSPEDAGVAHLSLSDLREATQ